MFAVYPCETLKTSAIYGAFSETFCKIILKFTWTDSKYFNKTRKLNTHTHTRTIIGSLIHPILFVKKCSSKCMIGRGERKFSLSLCVARDFPCEIVKCSAREEIFAFQGLHFVLCFWWKMAQYCSSVDIYRIE